MPKTGLRASFDLETRNKYTKVDCEIGLNVNGRELPSMAVLGEALEKAIELIQNSITESYKVVPPRDVEVPKPVEQQPAPVATQEVAAVRQQPVVEEVEIKEPEPVKPMTTFG
jgi:hypothetical protein